MNIACLGYGVVGKGVVEIFANDSRVNIKHILVRDLVECPFAVATLDIQDILNDDSVDCVVEMMGGIDFPYYCIKESLIRGKHVVTSNKAVMAAHYQELLTLAKEHHVQLRLEASVGGGIPWIHSLLQQIRIGNVYRIEGIFNGTTNYIFDQMHTRHEEYSEILKEAQSLGYAESDPSSDVDGYDIQRKLMISSSIAYKTVVDMSKFTLASMRNIQLSDILYFEKYGFRCRYFAISFVEDGKYFGSVEPTLFEATTQPACVSVNHNLTILYHDTLGVLQLVGQGAGRYPTANAVVQDILDVYEEKWSNILIENELTYDDSLSNTRLCICTSDEGLKVFDAYLVRKEQVGNRFYGWTMDLNNDVKCQLVKEASKKDVSFFYAVVR